MTPTREQLEAFAYKVEDAFKLRGRPFANDGLQLKKPGYLPLLFQPSGRDGENAQFVIWGLDRLEEMGELPHLYKPLRGGSEYLIDSGHITIGEGDTRALAVFWALFRALGCAEPQGEHPTPTQKLNLESRQG